MSDGRGPATSEDVLRLVRQALDEFDQVPLEATMRRTIRIANLLGETYAALRLSFDLRPGGGTAESNVAIARRLMPDPERYQDIDGDARRAVEEFITDRTNTEGLVVSHCIAEIEFWQRERLPNDLMSEAQAGVELGKQQKMLQILARTRAQAFTYLCQWERELTFAAYQDDALATTRRRVDRLLSVNAPDVLERFNVAFRRLRKAAERDSGATAEEELSQALTSCRRILKAVVDVVQPADPARPTTEDGHDLADEHYKNRLVEFLKANVNSASFRSALVKDGESLFERFATIDGLSSKGVHASVARDEAEFCALHTYTLVGEILAIAEQGGEPAA